MDVLVDTGAQVSLVRRRLFKEEFLQPSRRPVRLKVANGEIMSGGTHEATISMEFWEHERLNRPDQAKRSTLSGNFYVADITDWDMIMGYDFMVANAIGALGAIGDTTHTAHTQRTPATHPAVGGQTEEGQRLTPSAPHNGGRHPPRGRPSATPTASNAGPQGRTLWGQCWVPTPAPTAPRTRGSRNPGCTLRRTGGRGRDSAWHQAPLTTLEGTPPRGRPSATPTASNAGPQGRTLWGRCWVHTPASTAPGTHGSRNPGCTLRRTSGRGRDSG